MIKRIKGLFKRYGFTLMELLVVLGIFTLIMGASFTLVSTGRISVALGEAQIQAEESARQALNRLSKELRLSKGSKVDIYDSGTGQPGDSGDILFLQTPVVNADGTLVLNTDKTLQWGSEDYESGQVIYVVGENKLMRGASSIAKGLSYDTVAANISSITFSREEPGSDLITISITATGKSGTEETTCSLSSTVKLRN